MSYLGDCMADLLGGWLKLFFSLCGCPETAKCQNLKWLTSVLWYEDNAHTFFVCFGLSYLSDSRCQVDHHQHCVLSAIECSRLQQSLLAASTVKTIHYVSTVYVSAYAKASAQHTSDDHSLCSYFL